MKRWAVSFIDWYDHELSTVIVQAETWQEALLQHPKVSANEEEFNADWMAKDIESAKQAFFDCDSMFECKEIIQ